MKLRNKKTGEIVDLMGTLTSCPYVGIGIDYHDGNPKAFYYDSLTELNADWEDYTPEPDPSYLIAKIQKLENSVKELDERLKTVEKNTERQPREHYERILGEAKQYRLELPPRVAFERMKQDLRDWIEENKIKSIQIFIHTEPDGRRGVRFFDKTNAGDNHLIIIGWPTIGLVDGATYTPDELLITGEAGKE